MNAPAIFGSDLASSPGRARALSRRIVVFVQLCVLGLAGAAPGGTLEEQSPKSDRLGLGCAQILQMTSSEWVAHFNEKFKPTKEKDANLSVTDKTLRAIAAYGRCYDARTTRLAEQARKNGGNDLLAASIQFRNFDQALQAFIEKALASSEPPAEAVKGAYAALYAQQFQYEFYRQRQTRNFTPPPPTPGELEQIGNAKNQLGSLLDDLPPQKMKDLHAAFSRIFNGPVTDQTKLAVYRLAIFCLEPPSDTPFAPPPF